MGSKWVVATSSATNRVSTDCRSHASSTHSIGSFLKAVKGHEIPFYRSPTTGLSRGIFLDVEQLAIAKVNQLQRAIRAGMGESPRGVSPRGARRTVRDTLASYGSHQAAPAQHGPVGKQLRGATGNRRHPLPCTPGITTQFLVFLTGPADQFLI